MSTASAGSMGTNSCAISTSCITAAANRTIGVNRSTCGMPAPRELQYLYIESAGGFSRGTVAADQDALVFPPTHYWEGGVEQIYRSRWQRLGADAYEVITEFQVKGIWTPGFTLHMRQSSS